MVNKISELTRMEVSQKFEGVTKCGFIYGIPLML
jgi:hypothetical protein